MIHHSAVSLDYLEKAFSQGRSPVVPGEGKSYAIAGSTVSQRRLLTEWRSQGYAYAPPCDNVTPDGRCAGHEKEE